MMTMEIMTNPQGSGPGAVVHEKPFAGINGAAKHNNWSRPPTPAKNLLKNGDNPHDNAQFLVFCEA